MYATYIFSLIIHLFRAYMKDQLNGVFSVHIVIA